MFVHDMNISSALKRFLILAFAIVLVLAVLGVAAFDRYRYYDYEQADCSTDEFLIKAWLEGSFQKNHPNERSSPYFLRVEVVSKFRNSDANSVSVSDLVLASSATGKEVNLQQSSRHDFGDATVYLVQSITMPFEDYELKGKVKSSAPMSIGKAEFRCRLHKRFGQELRIPLWDAILSA
ncbi:hypothetical protein [Lysobacter sp. CA199]|uniref:hypothetical protein n=1 Tax=Lysobacter sp. CA199 TaxID=3455608 RepID=UPI003F8D1140